MEDSIQSSKNRAPCSKVGNASSEESGWTTYFEEFWAAQKREASFSGSSVGVGSSMISDAASCVAWKPMDGFGAYESCKVLSFKKRKVRGHLDEDPLGDTASSPVNSPKVADLNGLGMNPRKKDDLRGVSQEKDAGGEALVKLGTNMCTELKKRGLCLVPLSMLADYHK